MKWNATLALTLALNATITQAAPKPADAGGSGIGVILAAEKRELAKALASQDSALRQDLIARLKNGQLAVDLNEWLTAAPASETVKSAAERTDYEIRRRKGLDREVDHLLQLRLADASMLPALQAGIEPLYAYEPAGDESRWQSIEAFDRLGGVYALDVYRNRAGRGHRCPEGSGRGPELDAQESVEPERSGTAACGRSRHCGHDSHHQAHKHPAQR